MLPDKIYVPYETDSNYISKQYYSGPTPKMENAEYIRKDIVDEMNKSAEDHAYFAGQEKLRENLLEWTKEKEGNSLTHDVKLAYRTMIDKIESL